MRKILVSTNSEHSWLTKYLGNLDQIRAHASIEPMYYYIISVTFVLNMVNNQYEYADI